MTTDAHAPSAAGIAARFIDALQRLEREGDVEALVELYAADGVAGNVLRIDAFHGADGAREFWSAYRGQFGEIASTFVNVIEGDTAALEWSSTGTINGRSVEYRGVTVVEAADGEVRRTCAYFDPTALAWRGRHRQPIVRRRAGPSGLDGRVRGAAVPRMDAEQPPVPRPDGSGGSGQPGLPGGRSALAARLRGRPLVGRVDRGNQLSLRHP